MKTTVLVSTLPAGLAKAVAFFTRSAKQISIHAAPTASVSYYSQSTIYSANALVADLDVATIATRTGMFGGNNGYNSKPVETTWHPDFDDASYPVPEGGAILVGHLGSVPHVVVHPSAYALRWVTSEIARDALLDGRLADAAAIVKADGPQLTPEECVVLYAHQCYKSGDSRKAIVSKNAAALESCIARGLIKRSKNGACAITVEGKAMDDLFRKVGENLAYSQRW